MHSVGILDDIDDLHITEKYRAYIEMLFGQQKKDESKLLAKEMRDKLIDDFESRKPSNATTGLNTRLVQLPISPAITKYREERKIQVNTKPKEPNKNILLNHNIVQNCVLFTGEEEDYDYENTECSDKIDDYENEAKSENDANDLIQINNNKENNCKMEFEGGICNNYEENDFKKEKAINDDENNYNITNNVFKNGKEVRYCDVNDETFKISCNATQKSFKDDKVVTHSDENISQSPENSTKKSKITNSNISSFNKVVFHVSDKNDHNEIEDVNKPQIDADFSNETKTNKKETEISNSSQNKPNYFPSSSKPSNFQLKHPNSPAIMNQKSMSKSSLLNPVCTITKPSVKSSFDDHKVVTFSGGGRGIGSRKPLNFTKVRIANSRRHSSFSSQFCLEKNASSGLGSIIISHYNSACEVHENVMKSDSKKKKKEESKNKVEYNENKESKDKEEYNENKEFINKEESKDKNENKESKESKDKEEDQILIENKLSKESDNLFDDIDETEEDFNLTENELDEISLLLPHIISETEIDDILKNRK